MDQEKERDTLEDVIAEALHKHTLDRTHERIGSCEMQLDRIRRVFGQARQEADRSSAILLFALAEDMMLSCFKAHMDHEIPGGWQAVTNANGVLATASDRLMMMQLLRWVRPSIAADLRLMKSIRNRFAHHADVESFTEQKVSGWITSMHPSEKRIFDYWAKEGRSVPQPTMRELFLVRAIATLISLSVDIAINPISRQERVNPFEIGGGEFESMPENVQNAFRLQAELVAAMWEI